MEKSQAPNLDQLTDAVRDTLTVRRVFGEPIESGAAVIIPVAKISGGSGVGFGSGESTETTESESAPGTGEGGGGGFGVRAKPAGVYRIHNGEVSWEPALDIDRLAVGGMLLGALSIVAWTVSSGWRNR